MGRILTDIVDGVFLRHELHYAGHYVHDVVFGEEVSTQLGIVADEDAGIKLALIQSVSSILEEGLREALEA